MEKQDFTIEGSIPLKEAFVKESGTSLYKEDEYHNITKYDYLTPCIQKENKGKLQGYTLKESKHFCLPQQWDEALEYVKYYFEEKPEFKAGDWVYWSGVNPRIGKLECRCTSFSESSWKPVEGDYSWNEMHLKLATQEEILEHLQVEFTERTGIDVGSETTLLPYKKRYIGDVLGTSDSSWYRTYPVEDFKLSNNELFVKIKTSSWNNKVWFECNALVLAKPKLTFGGSEVTLEKVSSGVRVNCGGECGTLSQMEKIYAKIISIKSSNSFGSVDLREIEFEDEGIWRKENINKRVLTLTIGCTTGTYEEFLNILEEARKLN